jgi:DNA-binding Lrp family transcriptional regulator
MPAGDKELTFLDLMVLQRIGPDTTLERFGSKINSSYFDAANILGSIRLKGYVEIESSIGASKVSVSEAGKAILAMAEEKSHGEIDELDKRILGEVSRGVKDVGRIGDSLNIRSGDLSYHIYKLVKNNYVDYDLRAGKVSVMLTENGFKNARPAEEEPGADENLGEEIAEGKDGPGPGELKPVDIRAERARSKMDYYVKRWKGYGIYAAAAVAILLLLLAWYFFGR